LGVSAQLSRLAPLTMLAPEPGNSRTFCLSEFSYCPTSAFATSLPRTAAFSKEVQFFGVFD